MQNLAGSAVFFAPRGTFSTCPPRFPPPPIAFPDQIFAPDKHKVSASNAPTKSDPNYSPLKKEKRLKKKFTFNTSNIYISL